MRTSSPSTESLTQTRHSALPSRGMKDVTVYFHIEGGDLLDMYQFSFTNDKLASKAEF